MKSGSAETLRGKKATKLESEPGLPAENVQHKITALKQRPEPTDKKSNPFQYDPNEPLRLPVVKGRGTDST